MKKLLLLSLLLNAWMAAYAQAPDSTAFTLEQAIQYAFKHQASVQNAVLEEQIAQKRVNELVGLGTPQINASAELNDFLEIPVSFVPGDFFGEPGTYFPVQFGQQFTGSAGITATQLLFDGTYLVGLQASRTYQELSRKQSNQTRTETALAVSKAYYGALVSQARMELIDANLVRVKKLMDDTRALNENGFVEKIDVDRIELTYNNLLVEKEKVQRFQNISYAILKFQMGYPAGSPITLTDSLNESVVSNVQMPDSVDFGRRPEYQVLDVTRRMQELDVKRYNAAYLPSITAFGSYSYLNSRSDFDIFNFGLKWFPSAVIGARINIPIWDGLQKSSRVSQAKLNLKKVENSITLMKNSFQIEMETARSNYQNNYSSLLITKKNRDLAREIARVSKVKYDSGVGSSLEVIDAESSLREADANFFNTLYETIISRLELDKASGKFSY